MFQALTVVLVFALGATSLTAFGTPAVSQAQQIVSNDPGGDRGGSGGGRGGGGAGDNGDRLSL